MRQKIKRGKSIKWRMKLDILEIENINDIDFMIIFSTGNVDIHIKRNEMIFDPDGYFIFNLNTSSLKDGLLKCIIEVMDQNSSRNINDTIQLDTGVVITENVIKRIIRNISN